MTLDDLSFALGELERRLDADQATAANARRARASLHRSEASLQPLRRTLWWELWITVLGVCLLVPFLLAHGAAPLFAASGMVLLLAEAAHLAATVRQLVQLYRLDYAGEVVGVQRELARLWALRSRVNRAVLVLAPLMWTPLAAVALKGLFGVDVVATAGMPWVAANLTFGIAVLGLAMWAAWARPGWVERSPRLGRMSDHLTGQRLRRALDHAEAAADFERDLA